MRTLDIVLVGTAVVLLAGGHLQAERTRFPAPTQSSNRGVLVAEYAPAPKSFDELWSSADAIVRGTVKDTSLRRSAHAKRAVPIAQHRLALLEVLKGAPALTPGRNISVIQMAGSLDIDGMQITVDPGAMPVLAPGQEVLLFLAKDDREGAYSIARGPAGVYVLDDATVVIPKAANALLPLFGDRRELPKEEFAARMRAMSSQKGAVR